MKSTSTHSLPLDQEQRSSGKELSAPAPLAILDKAISGGVTSENLAVVKELVQMCREQRAEDAKAAFAKAYFSLRKNMPEIYADKQAKDKHGNPTFSYCSEEELAKKLEPHLMSYGFAMLFGQKETDGKITVTITLMHEQGHAEDREFTVRTSQSNSMKDGTMCDTGAATTAWRHLMIKMFGLKSRIKENQNAQLAGEKITPEQALYLRERVKETGSDEARFLKLAQAERYEDITEDKYDLLVIALGKKERPKG